MAAALQSKQSGIAGSGHPGAVEPYPSPSQSHTSPVGHAMEQPGSPSGEHAAASEHVGPPLPVELALVDPDVAEAMVDDAEDVVEPTVDVDVTAEETVAPAAVVAPPAPSVVATSGVHPAISVAMITGSHRRARRGGESDIQGHRPIDWARRARVEYPIERSRLPLRSPESGGVSTALRPASRPRQAAFDATKTHLYVLAQRSEARSDADGGNWVHVLDVARDGTLVEVTAPVDLTQAGVSPTAQAQGLVVVPRPASP